MDWIVSSLKSLYPDSQITVRPDERIALKEGADFSKIAINYRCPDSVEIKENHIRMKVNLKTGQKTGFFLDQRENRLILSQHCEGNDVLDCFCYTGGFAISAMLAGAKTATGIDLDEKALETAHENAKLNAVKISFIHVNVFDYLRKMISENKKADVVILDPSKLAGCTDEIKRAHRTYGDINKLGMQVVKPGGILLTCSCSGRYFAVVIDQSTGRICTVYPVPKPKEGQKLKARGG
jgi:23S rRNA (cytosine1962-C5)-methyltransferase